MSVTLTYGYNRKLPKDMEQIRRGLSLVLCRTNMSIGSQMISPQFISTKPDRDQLTRKEYFPYVNKTS